eukprot:756973-Amphidinium_carterae.1
MIIATPVFVGMFGVGWGEGEALYHCHNQTELNPWCKATGSDLLYPEHTWLVWLLALTRND